MSKNYFKKINKIPLYESSKLYYHQFSAVIKMSLDLLQFLLQNPPQITSQLSPFPLGRIWGAEVVQNGEGVVQNSGSGASWQLRTFLNDRSRPSGANRLRLVWDFLGKAEGESVWGKWRRRRREGRPDGIMCRHSQRKAMHPQNEPKGFTNSADLKLLQTKALIFVYKKKMSTKKHAKVVFCYLKEIPRKSF